MQLIINRSFEPDPSERYDTPYKATIRLEVSDEEQKLITAYGLEKHVLTQSEYDITTVSHVIRGTVESVSSLAILIGNEKAIRNACSALPSMLDYCRSFDSPVTVEL